MKGKTIAILVIIMVLLSVTSLFIYRLNLQDKNAPGGSNYTEVNELPPRTNNTSQNPTGTADSIPQANNLFALDLYKLYKDKNENIFLSPYSISSALTMTYEGAKETTATEMNSVLHLPSNIEQVRSGYVNINNELNKVNKPYNLSVANALWAQNDFPFYKEYMENIEKYYGGKSTNLNFKTETEKSRVTINTWIESKTNNKIKNLIPQGSLTSDTRLVLTNAIYFKANWTSQFKESATSKQEFTKSSNSKISVDMMHQTSNFEYVETPTLQVLELPYLGDDLSMIILLPKENKMSEVENSLTLESLNALKSSLDSELVQVSLPRFKFETKYFMKGDLVKMGMPSAFSPEVANFKNMGESKDENLYISEVVHQTFVNVTESGTEAAAATAVIMMGTTSVDSHDIPKPKIFKADHPFIFMIQDQKSGTILFIGKMNDPSKE